MDPIQEKLIVLETLLKQLTSMKASPDIISAVLSEIDRLKNGGNLWSLYYSTGVLVLPPGGSVFIQSTTGWQLLTTGLIWFITGSYTDTNTYSHAHLSRFQFTISEQPVDILAQHQHQTGWTCVYNRDNKTDKLRCTPGWIRCHLVQRFQQRDTLSLITTLSVKHWSWTNELVSHQPTQAELKLLYWQSQTRTDHYLKPFHSCATA